MFKNLNIACLGITGSQSEVIELALSNRFAGMDLDLAEFAAQVDAHGLPHARRLIDSARIRIGSFPLPEWWDADEKTYKQGQDELMKLGELAQTLGCKRCLVRVRPACDERPYHENFEFHRRRLTELSELAGQYGLRIGLQFSAVAAQRQGYAFQFIHSFDALTQLAKMVPGDRVGVVVDLWQIHVGGGTLDDLRLLPAARIVAVILSDIDPNASPAEADEQHQCLPGERGAIDAAGALALLAELGYRGPVTPQAGREQLQGKSRDAKVKLAAERLTELWKQAGLKGEGRMAAPARG